MVRALAAFGAVLLLGGCGAGAGGPAAAPTAHGAFPITVEHSVGTTTIPAEPLRIVALSGEEDTLALLGITPVAFSEAFGTPGERSAWLDGQTVLDGATILPNTQSETGLNLEAIAALDPDLILATNLYAITDQYPQLSGIAPTVGPPAGSAPGEATWQQLSLLVGEAVGRAEQAAGEVARVEGFLADTKARLSGLTGKTFTSSYYYQAGVFATIDSTETGAAALLAQLGMTLAPRVTAEVRDRTVSLEQIGVLDADFVAIGYAGEELRSDLRANPLFQTLGASRAGHVFEMSDEASAAANNPTIQNVPWQIELYRPVLEEVAAP